MSLRARTKGNNITLGFKIKAYTRVRGIHIGTSKFDFYCAMPIANNVHIFVTKSRYKNYTSIMQLLL